MQNPLANFIGVLSLVRDDQGFQVNPLCRHDITSPFPLSGNGGYVRNLGDLVTIIKMLTYGFPKYIVHSTYSFIVHNILDFFIIVKD